MLSNTQEILLLILLFIGVGSDGSLKPGAVAGIVVGLGFLLILCCIIVGILGSIGTIMIIHAFLRGWNSNLKL